jgi:hypothetical protein
MKRACIVIAALGAIALSGCKKPDAAPASSEAAAEDPWWTGQAARYQGVGLYAPDRLWTKMAAVATPKDAAAALVADDSQVIVVVDSRTGEIRQCGNRSGACVAMNPWDRKLVQPLLTPVALTEHEKPEPQPMPDATPAMTPRWRMHHPVPDAASSQGAAKLDATPAPGAGPAKP